MAKSLTGSTFAQQLPTTRNNMQQGVQTDAICNIQQCWSRWPTMLRLFAWGFNIIGCYMLRPFAHPVACCRMLLRVVAQSLKPVIGCVQTGTTLLTNNSQHCWMLHVASVCTPYCMLAQSLKPVILLAPCKRTQHCWLTTPNIVGSCCVRLHVAILFS